MSAATAESVDGGSGQSPEDLVTAILTASRVLLGVSVRSLGAVGDTVTLPQFRTLVVLDGHGEMSLGALAEALGVNASSALRMIDRLLVTDLVTRRQNPENRRQVLIGLTPAGAALVRRATNVRRREIARVVEKMHDGQRADLVRALRSFAEAADEPLATVDGPDGAGGGIDGANIGANIAW
jgi:DNA-binding MarR family transcriptional regulator